MTREPNSLSGDGAALLHYHTNTDARERDAAHAADSVVLAISGEKDGNLRVVYARIGRAKVVLLGEVLKLRWRGPTPPLRVTWG
jgi:hypothetical protein